MAPFEERFASAERLAAHPRMRITGIEGALGTTYTAQTLARLTEIYTRIRFIWIMGADNLIQIPKWKETGLRYFTEFPLRSLRARPILCGRSPGRLLLDLAPAGSGNGTHGCCRIWNRQPGCSFTPSCIPNRRRQSGGPDPGRRSPAAPGTIAAGQKGDTNDPANRQPGTRGRRALRPRESIARRRQGGGYCRHRREGQRQLRRLHGRRQRTIGQACRRHGRTPHRKTESQWPDIGAVGRTRPVRLGLAGWGRCHRPPVQAEVRAFYNLEKLWSDDAPDEDGGDAVARATA